MNERVSDSVGFIEKPTGEVDSMLSPEQKEAAVEDFVALVDDLLLAYAAYVEVSSFKTKLNSCYLRLHLLTDDDISISFFVHTQGTKDSPVLSKREIGLSIFSMEEGFQQRHIYRHMAGTSEVTRSDEYKKSDDEVELENQSKTDENRTRQEEFYASMGPVQFIAEAIRIQREKDANQELEKQMALNHLPVSNDEIKALKGLVYSAAPTQKPRI